jgi:hypothetical protein
MATTSRTGMTILGLVAVAVLGLGGTVLAAGGAHRHAGSDDHTPLSGSMMGMMGRSMMGDVDECADHDPMMSMMSGSMMGMMGRSMMGDHGAWVDHDPRMDASGMATWMWEHMSQHMGVFAPEAEPETEAAEGPASETPSDEPEPEPAA